MKKRDVVFHHKYYYLESLRCMYQILIIPCNFLQFTQQNDFSFTLEPHKFWFLGQREGNTVICVNATSEFCTVIQKNIQRAVLYFTA